MRHLADGASAGTSKMKYQKTFCLFSTLLAGSVAAGCATGVEDSDGSGGSSGDDTNASSSTAARLVQLAGLEQLFERQQFRRQPHVRAQGTPCGGICAPNSVRPGVINHRTACHAPRCKRTVKCSEDGLCDVDCTSGYVKSGNTCQCTQCCSDSDCGSGQQCDNANASRRATLRLAFCSAFSLRRLASAKQPVRLCVLKRLTNLDASVEHRRARRATGVRIAGTLDRCCRKKHS